MKPRTALRTGVTIFAWCALVVGGFACGDTPVTPKSQCSTGSTRVVHKDGKTTYQECHNNEWVKVDCFSGGEKTEVKNGRATHYVCRSNEWEKQ
jgi:hypothetical protein